MRRLVWLAVVPALLWSAWWVAADRSLEAGLARWFEARRAEGWQADVARIRSGGFPLRLEQTLEAPMLADPGTGVAFSTEALHLSAPVWWPGHVTVTFPGEQIALASPLQRLTLGIEEGVADLRLRPGTALELQEMALTAGLWGLAAPQGSIAGAEGLTLRMRQEEETRAAYAITADAPAFQPGSLIRSALRVPDDWPVAFDALALEARVVFDQPFDRRAIEEARPQPGRIDLTRAEATWGELVLRAAAGLDVLPGGLLDGEVSVQARNWREMLTLAETAGVLPPALRPQVERVLEALAQGSGNPESLDLSLTLTEGTIYLGFIPLGPAPRAILR